eukprot:767851-Hanusia_phi.AAC.2
MKEGGSGEGEGGGARRSGVHDEERIEEIKVGIREVSVEERHRVQSFMAEEGRGKDANNLAEIP